MTKRYETSSLIPLMILGLVLLILYHRLLFGEVFVWGLPTLQFYPWRAFAVEILRQGELPLWNPYNGAGAPLLANYQSALLYPPSWLSFALPMAQTMSITAVLHLFVAGWGIWMLGGRLGYTSLGRGLSTLAFALTSYLVARLGTFPLIAAAAWLPWMVWAALGIVQNTRARDVVQLAFFTALLLLAGHAQTAWYSLLLTGLFALWSWARHPVRRPWALAALAAAVALGAGAASLQLLATGELLLTSQRAEGVDYDVAMNFSYVPLRTLNLLSPNIFGNPGNGSVLGSGAFFEDAVYIGLIPLVSALAAVVTAWRTRQRSERPAYLRDVPFWAGVVLVAYVFALGRNTPVFPFLYWNIPTFDLFQAPVRWHLWTVFGLSILAGAGVAGWAAPARISRWTRRLTVASGGVLLVAIVGQMLVSLDDTLRTMLNGIALTSFFGLAAGLLTLRMPRWDSPRYAVWSLVVLVIVAADVALAAVGLNPTALADFQHTGGDANASRSYWPPEVEERVKFDDYFQFDDYRTVLLQWEGVRASGLPNINLLDGQPMLNNFDPLVAGNYVAYRTLIEEHPDEAGALLQAAHVGEVYTGSGETRPLPGSSQRVWLVEAACWHSTDAQTSMALLAAGWDRRNQVHLAGSGPCEEAEPLTEEGTAPMGSVLSIDDRLTRLDIAVQTSRPAWLVVADTYYPGWQAEVDGSPIPIERANLAFRAVRLDAGEHRVTMTYAPGWWLPGIIITALAWFAMLILLRVREAPPNVAAG